MVYYCLECKKNHADNYKVHWKYKSQVMTKNPEREIDMLTKRVKDLENEIESILGILVAWKPYIDRKHPYPHLYQLIFDDLFI